MNVYSHVSDNTLGVKKQWPPTKNTINPVPNKYTSIIQSTSCTDFDPLLIQCKILGC